MKSLRAVLVISCMVAGCVKTSSIIRDNNYSQTEVAFKSEQENVDILEISGLDMGPMYSPASYTPKYVGRKSYISYHDVKLAQELVVRWRISDDDPANEFKQVVKRPKDIPETIPREHMVIFLYSGGQWTIMMNPLE